jgi:hypothetical protein
MEDSYVADVTRVIADDLDVHGNTNPTNHRCALVCRHKAVELNGDPIFGVNIESTYLYAEHGTKFPLYPPAPTAIETVEAEI